MKFFVLGAGFYGAHLATILLDNNIEFKIADITNDFFTGSSLKNQRRLHCGFHYPRSYTTRKECIEGYHGFKQQYPEILKIVDNNYYFIDKNSIIDLDTYKHIFLYENIDFLTIDESTLEFAHDSSLIQGILRTDEMFIDCEKAKLFFKNKLKSYMIDDFNTNKLLIDEAIIYENEKFDVLLDCTYSHSSNDNGIVYELCVSFLFTYLGDDEELFGFTVVDGNFFSIYPYNIDKKLYSLTDVKHTPVFQSSCIHDVTTKMKHINIRKINLAKQSIVEKVVGYIPKFHEFFEYHSYFLSVKSKNINSADDRSVVITNTDDKILKFHGGKITGVIEAGHYLKKFIHT